MQHYGSCSHAIWLSGLCSGQNVSCFSAVLCWRSSALVSKVWVLLMALFFRISALAATGLVAESLCDAFTCFSSKGCLGALWPLMQMCCNWAWQRWSQELVPPVDFTGEQELFGRGLLQFWRGRNGVSIESVIFAFCEPKPKQWDEGAAAVLQRGLSHSPAPGMASLKFEGWLHPFIAFSLMVPLCGSFWGFYQTKSLCQGDVLLLRREELQKGEVWNLLEQHHVESERGGYFTVAWLETKSQHLRQTITRPKLTEPLFCAALSIVAVLLC